MSIITASEVGDYLGLDNDQIKRRVAASLAGRVEAFFLSAIGRAGRPFLTTVLGGVVEAHDGTGTDTLWLHYPLAALASVTLGFDPANPEETLDVADPAKLVWSVGSARLARPNRHGSWAAWSTAWPTRFGGHGWPKFVHVTYDAAKEVVPIEAGLAILRVTSAVWSRRGSELVVSERIGGYSVDFGAVVKDDPFWQAIVDGYRETIVV